MDPRTSPTGLLEGPSDDEIDGFLDDALEAATDDPAAPDPDDDPAPEKVRRSTPFFGKDEPRPDAEAEDDEDEEAAGTEEEDAEERPDPRTADLERQVREMQAERERERQAFRSNTQRVAVANTLVEMRAKMTDHEWSAFSEKLIDGFKDARLQALQGQLDGIAQEREDAEYRAAEADALDAIVSKVREEIPGLSAVEEALLRNSADPEAFKGNLRTITGHRQAQTEPARRALRERRAASGADRGAVRPTGGARPPTKTYDNFNPDRFDDYLNDLGAPR